MEQITMERKLRKAVKSKGCLLIGESTSEVVVVGKVKLSYILILSGVASMLMVEI